MRTIGKSIGIRLCVVLVTAVSINGCHKAPHANDSLPYLAPRLRLAADQFLLTSERLRVEKADLGKRLKAELLAGRYREVEAILASLDKTDRGDPRYEFVYRDTLADVSSCAAPDESMERPLLDMEDEHPHSAWPHMLLADYYESMACNIRGGGWASEVGADQWSAVQNFDHRGYAEYQEAMAVDPNLFPVYEGLIRITNVIGNLNQITAIYEQSRQHLPGSYLLAADYMNALKPRWHGNYSLMYQFANVMRKHVNENPRFYDLGGYVFADRADMAYRDQDFDSALHLYYRALGYGDYPSWLEWAAESAIALHGYRTAYAYYRRYLVYKPQDSEARKRWRAFAQVCATMTPVCRGTEGFPWGDEVPAGAAAGR
jgi:tetratricopeptide (TPR) repeat protein